VAYRTNAVTRHGEHGNALLARWPLGDIGHHDVSDHRFEQRGLLHVPVHWNGVDRARRGGALRAGARQPRAPGAAPGRLHRARGAAGEMLVVAGDFNDWGEKLDGPMPRSACACPRRGPKRAA
jgi:endonuclease/exonuclease/phosphatase family metal-dependent hydrolase